MRRRSWHGLDVTLLDTREGPTRVAAAAQHRLGLHVGRSVRARCQLDGRPQRRLQSRGDIDLVPAGVAGVWEDDRSSRMLLLSLAPALLSTAAAGLGLDPARVELTPRLQLRDPQLQHLGWALEAELAGPPGDTLYGDSLAMALAVHLVRRYRGPGGPVEAAPGGLSPAQLGRVLAHIDAHLADTLALAELAAVAGVSASHFKVLFRRSTGSPAHQYVLRQRAERARRLLGEGAAISEVAARTGFCDASHLARWLRRLYGLTPAALRG